MCARWRQNKSALRAFYPRDQLKPQQAIFATRTVVVKNKRNNTTQTFVLTRFLSRSRARSIALCAQPLSAATER